MSGGQRVYHVENKSNKENVSLHDVMFILKNGKKAYPPSITDLPTIKEKNKKWDSLLKYARNFEYDAKTDTLYHVGLAKKRDPRNPRRAKVLFSREKTAPYARVVASSRFLPKMVWKDVKPPPGFKRQPGKQHRIYVPEGFVQVGPVCAPRIELILAQVHGSGRVGLHLGAKRTQAMISERFYWRTITKDVKDWIAACPDCKKSSKSKQLPPDAPPLVAHSPWEVIGLDLCGPLPPSSLGYKYVCTATCHFSKWVEAEPLLDKSTESVFAALNKWIHRWGSPTCVIVDQGKELCPQTLNEQVFWQHGVRNLVTYHPATSSLTERSTNFVKRHIAKVINNGQNDWHLYLEHACWGLRATFSQGTGHSPFEIMTGRKPRFACEIDMESETAPLQVVLQDPTPNEVNMYMQQKEDSRAKMEKDLNVQYHNPQNPPYTNPY